MIELLRSMKSFLVNALFYCLFAGLIYFLLSLLLT